jgi:single-strand DNA-binding protein
VVNKVTLVGYLGRDAEVRHTASGEMVCTLNLATSESWKDKAGEKQERTEWHRVVLWGRLAESLSSYLTKGKLVYVDGSIQTRSYEKEGQKHYATDIRCTAIRLLGGAATQGDDSARRTDRSERPTATPARERLMSGPAFEEVGADEIPF